MLVFAAVMPPTPLLLPTIGNEQGTALAASRKAIESLRTSLGACHADAGIVISQHSPLPARFSIGIGESYAGSLKSFGDLTTYAYQGAPRVGHQILSLLPHGMASAFTHPELDHAVVTACRLLCPASPIPLAPVHPSSETFEAQVRFGACLRDSLLHSNIRIALLTIGDLSHHVTEASPEGYRAEGVLFDKAVLAAFKKKSVKTLIDTAKKYADESPTSGIRAFLIVLGILEDFSARFNLLSYESPFGIGYMTAEYQI